MALSNAEKQQRWREKHLGEEGNKAMLQVAVRKTTIDMLHRMARREETTIASLVEALIRERHTIQSIDAKAEREKAEAKKAKAREPRKPRARTHAMTPTERAAGQRAAAKLAAEHNNAMTEPEAAA